MNTPTGAALRVPRPTGKCGVTKDGRRRETCSLTNITFSKEAKLRKKNIISSIYESIYRDICPYIDI